MRRGLSLAGSVSTAGDGGEAGSSPDLLFPLLEFRLVSDAKSPRVTGMVALAIDHELEDLPVGKRLLLEKILQQFLSSGPGPFAFGMPPQRPSTVRRRKARLRMGRERFNSLSGQRQALKPPPAPALAPFQVGHASAGDEESKSREGAPSVRVESARTVNVIQYRRFDCLGDEMPVRVRPLGLKPSN